MRKKILAVVFSVMTVGMVLTGCGGSDTSSSSSESSSSESSEADADDSLVFANVTSIDGSEITYEILERDESKQSFGDKADGEKPDASGAPDGERSDASGEPDGEMPDASGMPDGEAPDASGMPDGEKPDASGEPSGKGGDLMGGFASTGETATITVDDSVKICFVQNDGMTEEASLSDISEGTMLQLQYSEDGELTEIDIPRYAEESEDGEEASLSSEE